MTNSFVWADLSTLNLEEAKRFYGECFGWKFQDVGEGYLTCQSGGQPAAGIYTMPVKFQDMGMPSFWMSYIHVPDIYQTVELAEKFGARVEIQPQEGPGGGLIALIRDPAGAGFTCYQGENPGGKGTTGERGRMAWNELHVSELSKVKEFYVNVFDWVITPAREDNLYDIHNSPGELIAGIRIYDNEVKGDKEYWAVFFRVANIQKSIETINTSGGRVIAEKTLPDRTSVLAYDSQGAAFCLLEESVDLQVAKNHTQSTVKWRAILGLCLVLLSVAFEAMWVWGVLFLIWVIPDIKNGSTHFLEHVERDRNPIVYWVIIVTWVVLSLYLFAEFV